VNAAKGFRSGGFNVASTDVPPYRPESLWSYEVGSKGLFFDRKFDLEEPTHAGEHDDIVIADDLAEIVDDPTDEQTATSATLPPFRSGR